MAVFIVLLGDEGKEEVRLWEELRAISRVALCGMLGILILSSRVFEGPLRAKEWYNQFRSIILVVVYDMDQRWTSDECII